MSRQDPEAEASHLRQVENVRITMDITPREAFELILRLSSDDDFRARVEQDPHGVLAEHHIDIPSGAIPLQASLPPKEKLQETLMELMAQRPTTIGELPFNVDPMYWMFMDFFIFLATPVPPKAR